MKSLIICDYFMFWLCPKRPAAIHLWQDFIWIERCWFDSMPVTPLRLIPISSFLAAWPVPYGLVYTYDESTSINISTRNLRVNRCDASTSALCLRLCLCLRRPDLHVRRNDASIGTYKHNRMLVRAYACVVASPV